MKIELTDNIEIADFGYALSAMKAGEKVARKGWNGKGMFVFIPENVAVIVPVRIGDHITGVEEKIERLINPCMAIKNVNGSISTWVPSVNDCLAEDWEVAK